MVINSGTWRDARQYDFAEEYRRKKAAQQTQIACQRWSRIRKMLWWPMVAMRIVALALIVWRPLQSVQINSVWDVHHLASAPNCNAARAVGLASARRGQPGIGPPMTLTMRAQPASHGHADANHSKGIIMTAMSEPEYKAKARSELTSYITAKLG